MFPPAESNSDFSQNTQISKWVFWLQVSYQKLLDDVTPWLQARWIATAFLLVIYILRVWFFGGWYIVSYALGIYMLNLLIGFLSPKVDPEMDVDADSTGTLPLNKDDEFRPFVRKLPEFKFWYSNTRAITIAIICTLTRATDIPVFYPILLLYFIALFVVTMRKQIKHMIKYKYIPFSFGKPKYQQKNSK